MGSGLMGVGVRLRAMERVVKFLMHNEVIK